MNPWLQRYVDDQEREHKHKREQKSHLKRCYGMTAAQHKAMYVAQGEACGVCREVIPYTKMQVDHDHATGIVRGLVCLRCNRMIGILERYSDRLKTCLAWIKKSK